MYFATDPINTIEKLIQKNKTKSLSIYIIIVFALVGFISSLPFIYVDISTQCRGIIRSKHDNVPITSIVNGRVVKNMIRGNKVVKQGDTLIIITVDNLNTEIEHNKNLLTTYQQNFSDLNSILSEKGIVPINPMFREEYLKFLAQKAELESKERYEKIKYDRHKTLYDQKVIAKSEYETYLFDLEYVQNSLKTLIKQQYALWQSQKSEMILQIKNIEGIIRKIDVEKENYNIIAPISGTIENYNGIQPGSYLNAGLPIAQISPDHDLIVETAVYPNDIGLIKIHQYVKFQIDAFNYHQWGLLTGKVQDIDRNVTIHDKGTFFNVRCSMDSLTMLLKSGYKTQVTKGMTLTTRFMITRRSLFDLLFDKMDDWLNPTQIGK